MLVIMICLGSTPVFAESSNPISSFIETLGFWKDKYFDLYDKYIALLEENGKDKKAKALRIPKKGCAIQEAGADQLVILKQADLASCENSCNAKLAGSPGVSIDCYHDQVLIFSGVGGEEAVAEEDAWSVSEEDQAKLNSVIGANDVIDIKVSAIIGSVQQSKEFTVDQNFLSSNLNMQNARVSITENGATVEAFKEGDFGIHVFTAEGSAKEAIIDECLKAGKEALYAGANIEISIEGINKGILYMKHQAAYDELLANPGELKEQELVDKALKTYKFNNGVGIDADNFSVSCKVGS